ncbi:MAG TPA: hypothetical protein VN783_01935, partial [Thermoanaerobaculia bacterium]|nr:hypothetical protein [Thermoanaerobaculia bacterium]
TEPAASGEALSSAASDGALSAAARQAGTSPAFGASGEAARESAAEERQVPPGRLSQEPLPHPDAFHGAPEAAHESPRADADSFEPAGAEDGALPLVARRSGRTEWGGLLFLIGLADEIGLPGEIAAHPLLAERPFRFCLHALALALAPLGADDPAALAFAGLAPGSKPPSLDEPPLAAGEMTAIADLAARLLQALSERLEEPAAGERSALVERVCRRRAEVVADPGWIEVHLSLDEVSTDIRRARLDLDPDFVPWLGVVLRFSYD